MRAWLRRAVVTIALCGALPGMQAAWGQASSAEPIRALPDNAGGDPARIALGRRLFYDTRLSRDGRMSCASCHDLKRGGVDHKALSAGFGGKLNQYNTPSVYNSALNFRQSWTGREATLEERLDHIVEGPATFASDWRTVRAALAADSALSAQFRQVYDEEPSEAYIKDALAQFLRSLITPSRFDRYLRGDANAITAEEKAGYAKFKAYGCVACHQGINVGGNMYQKIGVMRELPGLAPAGADLGRFQFTGREADRHVFRVPSLRNVALTAPYFHNGAVDTLDEAVDAMFKFQLGRNASAQDKELIVRFLHTLSGEHLPPPGAQP